jgi:Holliday junction DNA helicase RuvA
MISFLKGQLVEIEKNQNSTATLVILVSGVGYQVLASKELSSRLIEGDEVSFTVHTEVKEDAIRLYGFADKLEKQTFTLLNEVKGIGPKSAIEVLSKISAKNLLSVIAYGDLAKLKSVKGLGTKTAERIVVELKEKVIKFSSGFSSIDSTSESDNLTAKKTRLADSISIWFEDAQLALVALGFPKNEALKAVNTVERIFSDKSASIEVKDTGDIVKEALKHL